MGSVRVKDWLVGAVGMLLVLVAAIGILFWLVSEPVSGGETESVPPSSMITEAPTGAGPPANLSDDEVWLGDLELDAATVVMAGSVLRDVQAAGQDVVAGPDGMTAARLAVAVTVPFDVVAGELGSGTEVRAAEGGQVMVLRAVPVFGRSLPVVAKGTVEARAGKLVVEPHSIDLGGPDFLAGAVADVVRGLVTIEHEIEGLPEGLVLQDVTVQGDGFRATLQGGHVRFAR